MGLTADEIKNLKGQRGLIKGHITRLETFLNDFDQTLIKDYILLETKLELFIQKCQAFDNIQTSLEQNTPDEDLQKEYDERINFEDRYVQVLSRVKTCLLQKNVTQNIPIVNPQGSIKLPPLNLPEFHGNYESWFNFVDTFEALVNNNSGLANVQKFYYLQRCLKGEAEQVIKALEVTDANYDIAWDLLRQRFENKRLIVDKHLQAIISLPTLKQESHVALRNFIDTIQKSLRSLQSLGQAVDTWDTILIFICSQKIDFESKKEWENKLTNNCFPTIKEFLDFLTKRVQVLEKIDPNMGKQINQRGQQRPGVSFVISGHIKCSFCKENHFNNQCQLFIKLPVHKRMEEVKKYKLCTNCIRPGHTNKECRALFCKFCNKKHSSFLHMDNYQTNHNTNTHNNSNVNYSRNAKHTHNTQNETQEQTQNANLITRIPSFNQIKTTNTNNHTNPNDLQGIPTQTDSNANSYITENLTHNTQDVSTPINPIIAHSSQTQNTQTLLSTAIVNILDKNGNAIKCRALLDAGSQSCFMTKNLFNNLKLHSSKINMPINGISQISTLIKNKTQATIKSLQNNFTQNLSFLIIDKITDNIPQNSFFINDIPNIFLADPNFNSAGPVDILLGAEIVWTLLCIGQIRENGILYQKTKLGWIVTGKVDKKNTVNFHCNFLMTNYQTLNEQLEKFWRTEEIIVSKNLTNEELECEEDFIQNYKRDFEGRFSVKLPTRDDVLEKIGDTESMAIKRFHNLENKFSQNLKLKMDYTNFINEYESLGHMSLIDKTEMQHNVRVYLPHHGVFKSTSETTKLRVVFDASAKSSTNISLNNALKIGPVIQDELIDVVLRFRKHTYVFTADISKMYRQINVHENQRNLQCIVWRQNQAEKLNHFKLNTITYGTAPASFLATRCLYELAILNENKHKRAADIIRSDFYMDDLMTGAESIDEAKQLRLQIVNILQSAKLELRKWNSNESEIVRDTNNVDKLPEHHFAETDNTRVLGLIWNAKSDIFKYNVGDFVRHEKITKRSILSTIAKIFDPLGLVGPITIRAKILLQKLWQLKIDWNETVPQDIFTVWMDFREKLKNLNKIQIPRQVTIHNYTNIELHGFCDASTIAYGAAIYIRTTNPLGHHVKLLCAKSKVAPLKTVSLPRLELCSALLLARLVKKVIDALKLFFSDIYLWSDSSVTLSWIQSESNIYKAFVANRITEIQNLTPNANWNHVLSKDNPADIISRGISPEILENNALWWSGPGWLSNNIEAWPKPFDKNNFTLNSAEQRPIKQFSFTITTDFDIFNKYSSFTKLKKVTAQCLRFSNNCKNSKYKIVGSLTQQELDNALYALIKLVQSHEYGEELNTLKNKLTISRKNKLLPLNPFIQNGIIRVGGRIQNSPYSFDKKHPIILPSKHPFVELLIRYEHQRLLHAGAQSVLFSLRSKFWIVQGINSVKREIRRCVTCFKVRPSTILQPMGNLPGDRIKPTRPFLVTGTDFAGPFLIKDGKLRTRKIIKVYVCIFICFSTKAVHLELAGDLTSTGFLNVLKRFVSRRGICKVIYSDNGLNFIGADNELKRTFNLLFDSETDISIKKFLEENNIVWHKIPAKSPSFGGLWEAGVKSAKFHMKRIIGNKVLNYEELLTVVSQIEAVMNSRPITPLSNDPNDFLALTPSHFLIGDLLTNIPEDDVTKVPENRLNMYRQLTQMVQHFWHRWSKEYISNLQNRTKWMFQTPTKVAVGTLILLKEDNLPPLLWKLGRIVTIHPGKDDIVRVVTVKTTSGLFTRAVGKICILPIESDINVNKAE